MPTRLLGLAAAVLIAACAPSNSVSTSTTSAAQPTTSVPVGTTVTSLLTTTSVSTTTTFGEEGSEVILVTNKEGAFLVDGVDSVKLVDEATSEAFLDRAGGVVYQPARSESSEIWWQSEGSSEPQLAVAGPSEGYVDIQGVTEDGQLWYVEISGDWLDEHPDSLMSLSLRDQVSRKLADLDFGWAPEYHIGDGLTGLEFAPPTPSTTFEFAFYDEALSPVDASWNPYDQPTTDEVCWLCGVHLAVSDDGRSVAWKIGRSVTVVDVATGASHEFPVPEGVSDLTSIDVNDSAILLNHAVFYDPGMEWMPTARIERETGEVSSLEILGNARFAG